MPDRVRESIFGMLGLRVQGAAVVDLFAGSGSIGLEALSRGAASCMFVERDKVATMALRRNIEALRCEDRASLVTGDALGMAAAARAPRPADLIFLDPPFPLVSDPAGWARVKAQCVQLVKLLADDGFLILRTPNPFFMDAEAVEEGGAEAAAAGAVGPAGPARPGKPKKPTKYRRERVRWEEIPDAAPSQSMKRGGPLVPKRGEKPGKPVKPAEVEEELDEVEDVLYEIGDGPIGDLDAMGDDLEVGGGEADEADEGEGVKDSAIHVTGPEPTGPAAPKVLGDLSIQGAKGPETHAYGKSAVHWYMRDTKALGKWAAMRK